MQVSKQLIIQVAQEIFETLAFLSTRPVEEVEQFKGERLIMGVEYSGPIAGILILDVPVAMLPELAANMLGVDLGEQGDDQQQRDALGELANVLCGNLLGQLAGTEQSFNLQAPKMLDLAEFELWQAKGVVHTVKIGLNEGWATIGLVMTS